MALPIFARFAPKLERTLSVAFSFVFSDILRRHLEPVICIENAIAEQVYSRSKQDLRVMYCILGFNDATVERCDCGNPVLRQH